MEIDRKETVVSVIRHEETPLCPYTFGWEPYSDIAERLDSYYGSADWRKNFRNYIAVCTALNEYDGRRVNKPGPVFRKDYFGSVWRTDGRPIHVVEPALESPSLRGYRFPDVERFLTSEWERDVRKALEENADCFTVICVGFGLFERSWALRGFTEVLMDSVAEPQFFADLIATIAEQHHEKVLERFLDLPVDGILFSDDWGAQDGPIINPQQWREVLKPHYARLYARVRNAGKYVLHHSCGSIVEFIPDLIEIGLDVLESVQSEARGMNPYELKDRFGDQLTFWGGLGSQSIIPFGTPEALREEIRKLAAHMRQDGGYILACAKTLQPETPTENAAAILEEFLALGEQEG